MQHRGRAQTGAHVRRAGSEITEPLVVSELELAFERTVDLVHELERLLQLQAGADRLHAQMVLFVDHDAEGLAPVHDDRATCAFCGVFTADEMPLNQLLDPRLDQVENRNALGFLCPTGKGTVTEIARKTHPAADHDLMMRAFAAQPFAGRRHDSVKFHVGFVSSYSSCLIWSRSDAAVS